MKRVWISKEPLPLLRDATVMREAIDGSLVRDWARPVPFHFYVNHYDGTWGDYDHNMGTPLSTNNEEYFSRLYYADPLCGNCSNSSARGVVSPQWNLIITNGDSTHWIGNSFVKTETVPNQTEPEIQVKGEGAIVIMDNTDASYGVP